MICSIYIFTNKVNNKQYVGSTIGDPQCRYNQHIYNAKHENVHQYNYPLYQAMRKYGFDSFTFEVIYQEDCSEEHIRDIEREYIIKYNTLSPNGYNQTLETQHPLSDDKSYQKMSETKRENAKRIAELDNNNNIVQIWRSIVDCAEDTGLGEKHLAACCRGERHTTKGRYFCWIDDNDKLLIPEYTGYQYKGPQGTTQKQKTNKQVKQIDLQTQQTIRIYDSIALAARETGCDSSGISKVCRGVRNKCGGFGWEYV